MGRLVAAALLDRPLRDAETLLEELVDAQLVDVAGSDTTGLRYRLHDLVRLFARERAHAEEPVEQLGAPEASQVAAPLDRRLKISSGT